ncbi:MAG: SAM-dependent methyltransferase [Thaumarchaeota archaeon]|nr:MAG: SAM-dependent methyltransferase [Nitrososphaerota archaeon]
MKINDFISTLPRSVINGNTIRLPDNVLRRIFELARLNKKDIFYDLGCGNSNAIYIASREYKVKKAIGIEKRKIAVRETLKKTQGIKNVVVINEDIRRVDLSDGNVFLFWFHDDKITKKMTDKFTTELKDGSRIISIWSPPDLILPDKIDFPFFVSQTPFKFANSIEEQIKAVYGHKCLDFTAAWLLGDKYLESLEVVPAKYKRFLNILYSMIIWINAWNMEVACEDQIPPPVESYLGILKTFFNIDLSSLIENSHS